MIIAQPKEFIAKFVQERIGGEYPFKDFTALGLLKDEELVAGVVYNNYSPPMIMGHIAAIPSKRWLTRGFLFACFDYPFNQLGCNVLIGTVARKNSQAIKLDEHLGFILRGIIPEAYGTDDMLIYSMSKADCKWIGKNGLP